MGDTETKEQVSKKRKRSFRDKLKAIGDRKGAFAIRAINPKKIDYKREKMKLNDIEEDEE